MSTLLPALLSSPSDPGNALPPARVSLLLRRGEEAPFRWEVWFAERVVPQGASDPGLSSRGSFLSGVPRAQGTGEGYGDPRAGAESFPPRSLLKPAQRCHVKP